MQADGFLVSAYRLIHAAFLVEGDAEVVVGLGVIRFQAEGFLVLADRLVDLAFPVEGDAEVVVGVGVIWFQADGFLVLADRLVGLALSSRAMPRLCGRRRDPVSGGGLPGIGGSPRRFGLSCRGRRRGCMGLGVIRFQAEGFLELADRLVDLAFLVEGDAEVVAGEVIILGDFERMPEKGLHCPSNNQSVAASTPGRGRTP